MQAPQGWYQHPESPTFDAYWDGTRWTGDYRPHLAAPSPDQDFQSRPESFYDTETFTEVLHTPTSVHIPQHSVLQTPLTTQAPPQQYYAESRSKSWVIKAGVSLAVVVALVFSATLVMSRLGKSGAASPEEAMSSAVSALQNGDFLGLIDVMLPSERDMMKDPFVKGVEELKRLGVLDDSSSAGSAFMKYKMSGVAIRSETVTDDITRVYLSGTMTAEIDPDIKLGPVFDNLEEFKNKKTLADLDTDTEWPVTTEIKDSMFAAVKQDGRWYLSLGYTAAESARKAAGSEMPQTGVASVGSSSPEEAVSTFFKHVESMDLSGILSTLHPGEMGALQRYAPIFINDAQDEVNNFKQENSFSWAVSNLSLETLDKSKSESHVRIKDVTIKGAMGSDTFQLSLSHTGSDVIYKVTANDGTSTDGSLAEAAKSDDGLGASNIDPVFWENVMALTIKKWDGGWYIAPIASITDYMFAGIGTLTQKDLREILESESSGILEEYGSDIPFFSDESSIENDPIDDQPASNISPESLYLIDSAALAAASEASFEVSLGNTNLEPVIYRVFYGALAANNAPYSLGLSDQFTPTESTDGWIDFDVQDESSGFTVASCRFAYGPNFQAGGQSIVQHYCEFK